MPGCWVMGCRVVGYRAIRLQTLIPPHRALAANFDAPEPPLGRALTHHAEKMKFKQPGLTGNWRQGQAGAGIEPHDLPMQHTVFKRQAAAQSIGDLAADRQSQARTVAVVAC